MVVCAVPLCSFRSDQKRSCEQKKFEKTNGTSTFHQFPTNKEEQTKWLTSLNLSRAFISKSSRICSKHFKPESFIRRKKTILVKGAIPSLQPFPSGSRLREETQTDEENVDPEQKWNEPEVGCSMEVSTSKVRHTPAILERKRKLTPLNHSFFYQSNEVPPSVELLTNINAAPSTDLIKRQKVNPPGACPVKVALPDIWDTKFLGRPILKSTGTVCPVSDGPAIVRNLSPASQSLMPASSAAANTEIQNPVPENLDRNKEVGGCLTPPFTPMKRTIPCVTSVARLSEKIKSIVPVNRNKNIIVGGCLTPPLTPAKKTVPSVTPVPVTSEKIQNTIHVNQNKSTQVDNFSTHHFTPITETFSSDSIPKTQPLSKPLKRRRVACPPGSPARAAPAMRRKKLARGVHAKETPESPQGRCSYSSPPVTPRRPPPANSRRKTIPLRSVQSSRKSPRSSVSRTIKFKTTLWDSPRKKKLQKKLDTQRNRNEQLRNKLRLLQQSRRRDAQRIKKFKVTLKKLREEEKITEDEFKRLKTMGDHNEEFILRQIRRTKGRAKKLKFGPALRAFACTLHYYSPRAYRFVRDKFNKALPHPKTICKWYLGINGKPGFTQEALDALTAKSKASSEVLHAALIIDEMAIRKHADKNFEGYVDLGENLNKDKNFSTEIDLSEKSKTDEDYDEDEDSPEDLGQGVVNRNRVLASQAYVFMLVGINGCWKIPVGYFLIHSMKAPERAALVLKCLSLVHKTGVQVHSLTFDGTSTNMCMATRLGCDFKAEEIVTWFLHPEDNNLKVYIFCDPSHMLKLVRNTIGDWKLLFNSEKANIKWAYFHELHKLQEVEGLRLANKISSSHLHFHRQKMKVRLAAQLLSSSTAKALEVCRKLNLDDFKGSEATSEYAEKFDRLFDILNSRSLYGLGYKKALNSSNKKKVFEFFTEMETYIKGLHANSNFPNETRILHSKRKQGFLGFIVSMKSAKALFEDLCEKEGAPLKYLPLYKLSQDHVELFFGLIRARGGWNNSPSARHFKASYSRVLVHMELRNEKTGNCIPLEDVKILYCTSASKRPDKLINLSCNFGKVPTEQTDEHFKSFDVAHVVDHFYRMNPHELTLFAKNAVSYIAGFVVKSLSSKKSNGSLKCKTCIGGMIFDPIEDHRLLLDAKNINKKTLTTPVTNLPITDSLEEGNQLSELPVSNNLEEDDQSSQVPVSNSLEEGDQASLKKNKEKKELGLTIPGKDVVRIAEDCERIVRTIIHQYDSNIIANTHTTLRMTNEVMALYAASEKHSSIFRHLDDHVLEQEPLFNHKYLLIRCIATRYFDIRLHHIVRKAVDKANSNRHFWNKLILFKGY